MKVDLFELLDGFFRGVVYFIYNLFETIFYALRYPLRGPVYLYRAHLAKGRRQISGLTFMFVVFFAAHGAVIWSRLHELDLGTVRSELAKTFTSPFDPEVWWGVFVASLISTLIVDSVLRLILRSRLKDRRKRQAILAMTEYAMFILIVAVDLAFIVLNTGVVVGLQISHLTETLPYLIQVTWPDTLLLVGLACVAAVPTAKRFWRERPKARPRRRNAIVAGIRRAAQGPAIAGLLVLASIVGLDLGLGLEFVDRPPLSVELLQMDCHVDVARPFIDALLVNQSAEPILFDVRDMYIYIGPVGPGGELPPDAVLRRSFRSSLEPGTDFYGNAALIQPGQTRLVRGWLQRRPNGPPPPQSRCVLLRYRGNFAIIHGYLGEPYRRLPPEPPLE